MQDIDRIFILGDIDGAVLIGFDPDLEFVDALADARHGPPVSRIVSFLYFSQLMAHQDLDSLRESFQIIKGASLLYQLFLHVKNIVK